MTKAELVAALVDRLEEFHLPTHMDDVRLAERLAEALEAALSASNWCGATHGHAPLRDEARAAFLKVLTEDVAQPPERKNP